MNETNQNHDEMTAQSTLVDGATNAQNEREECGSRDILETRLLPKSIGDSQPRDRWSPASSLHSATTGRKRKAELIDKTCDGEKRYENCDEKIKSLFS